MRLNVTNRYMCSCVSSTHLVGGGKNSLYGYLRFFNAALQILWPYLLSELSDFGQSAQIIMSHLIFCVNDLKHEASLTGTKVNS